MAVNESVTVDINQMIDGKFKKNKVPRFVRRWLGNLIHQDFFNGFFRQGYLGVDFCEKALEYLGITVDVSGVENIPAEGRFTFAANHPLGGADALSVLAVIGRRFDGNIVVPANDFLMSIKPIAEYTIPVNKMGGQASALAVQLNEAFDSGRQMIIFPAGICSREVDGVVQDLPWQKTFITKSRASRRDIIPIWFSGQNSKRFYRVDKLRNLLKIKFNLAMLLLPDELYRSRGKHYRMVIGKPIPWETFTAEKRDREWAAWVRGETYRLAEASK